MIFKYLLYKMKRCQINSSELAIIIGKNNYGNLSDIILKYWKKLEPIKYKRYFEK